MCRLLVIYAICGCQAALAAGVAARQSAPTAPAAPAQRSACPAGYDVSTIQSMEPEPSGYGLILTLQGPRVNRQIGVLVTEARRLGLQVGSQYCAKSSGDDMVQDTPEQALQQAKQLVQQLRQAPSQAPR